MEFLNSLGSFLLNNPEVLALWLLAVSLIAILAGFFPRGKGGEGNKKE